ncbi:MAG: IS982 family transposase, partial [Candidatus Marinimicrobia bacterium]|nr:IS982 family transposase [Candidatus Neomarinimicrobiota bacterium]
FMIRRNYAKTFIGFATRILSKITAFTLLQYINKFITGRPLNHVKHALI